MSDSSQGPGWWLASDGKWYPPEQAPATTPPATPDPDPSATADPESSPPDAGPSPAPDTGPSTATPSSPAASDPGTSPPDVPPATPGSPTGDGDGNRRTLIVVAAVVAVLALIGAGILVVSRGGSDSAGTDPGARPGQTEEDGSPSGGDDQLPVGGADDLPSEDLTLTDDVVIVRGDGGKAIKGLGSDGRTIILDPAAEGADQLAAGKVLLLTGATVVKVAKVTETDAGLEVTAEPATLPDVIEDGTLEWEDMTVDPSQGQLLTLPGDGGTDDDLGDSGSSGDPGTTDDTTDEMMDEINDILGGAAGAPGFVEGESAAGVATGPGLVAKTVSGNAGGWGFSIEHNPDGGGHHLVLVLEPKSEMQGQIKADITLKPLSTSGRIVMVDAETKEFAFSTAQYGGTADVSVQLSALQNIASINLPPFFKLPFSLEFPAIVGGIPFTLKFAGTVQINMSLTATGNSLSAQAQITYDGDAGMTFNGQSLSLSGNRVQDAPDLLSKVVGSGQVGINFVTELPKVSFGFGFMLANAGVYISNGMVVESHVLPAPAMCTALNIAYVLAGGVEASFLTKDIELARKAFVDKRWNFQAPNDGRCNRDK